MNREEKTSTWAFPGKYSTLRLFFPPYFISSTLCSSIHSQEASFGCRHTIVLHIKEVRNAVSYPLEMRECLI